MTLESLDFTIPETAGLAGIAEWETVIVRAKKLAKDAGTGSDAFAEALRKAREGVQERLPLEHRLVNRRDIRATLYLLRYDEDYFEQQALDSRLLDRFKSVNPRLSRMSLSELISVFFVRFDKIAELEAVASYIKAQLAQLPPGANQGSLGDLEKNRDQILVKDGPRTVAQIALRTGRELRDTMRVSGIPMEDVGRYLELCEINYYIESIRSLEIGANHPVLSEVTKRAVKILPIGDRDLVGHAVVRELVAKVSATREVIPESWLSVILSIAGDPRTSRLSASYMHWWSQIGEEAIVHMRRWLSRFDFRLFLEVLEEYASASNNSELQRMFPARKAFMEGLFEQELIEDTRLFVGRRAVTYLKNNYSQDKLPSFLPISDSRDTSVIYLKVGGCHVVEGTHSFSIWIYDELPEGNPIQDYDLASCSKRGLGVGMAESYWQARNDFDPYKRHDKLVRITHRPDLWQGKVISALSRFGVNVDPSQVLPARDYRAYKRRYGVRVPKGRYVS